MTVGTPTPAMTGATTDQRRFGTLDARLCEALRAIVGAEHVLTTDGDVEPYSRDATPLFRARPDAVVLPAAIGSRIPIEALLLQIDNHVRLEQAAAESFLEYPTAALLHSRTISPLVQ